MAANVLQGLRDLVRNVFTAEKLDELPEVRPSQSRAPFLQTLRGKEELAEDPVVPDTRAGLLPWLLGREELPLDPSPAPAGNRSFLRRLFGGEQLPEDPVPGRRIGGRG